ncbi:MAG: 3-hydroxyacyl-CoA dehydrogenase NAD-binding domain-containing protein [Candidatus Electryonea clarkiae]|nr:3-hydroxyacyl-CoA dehydrogenase NAD-binding domain-containing protein [Candidatus Electryonea clarkiae]MDP8288422.1 3-hydroxyacyl-CoA dehydrogenase NAD-binding domain-containing protein [Candidatus Electryonea clarkiae]
MAKEETLRDLLGETPTKESEESLDRIAVIGAGQMGMGIAHAVSAKGIEVLLLEQTETTLKKRQARLEQILDAEIARWGLTDSDKRAILSRISWSTDLSETEGYKIIIEAVPDKMSIVGPLFQRLDALTSPDTVFVTNTSTLSVTEIAACTNRPKKIIGMHFLHPVPKRPLVEIIRGLKTSDDTVRIAKCLAKDIGKHVVEAYESPGFVTTRIILPMLNEAMYALMEGVATAEGIDIALRYGYDFVYGPLEMADRMGLDQVWEWMDQMFHETGEMKFRPCPILRKLVRAGHLGFKTGQGFFKYDDRGRRIDPAE